MAAMSVHKDIFQFKQFAVTQSKSAMKIGTDGVLLGAWIPIAHKPKTILDIGAGTGVVALMLAQRTEALTIDAVEVDEKAYVECTENFESSPWSDRLFCYHASFKEFVHEIYEKYDLIVSNPPFYTSDVKTDSHTRNKARFAESLPFTQLVEGVSVLLKEQGLFAIVLPCAEEESFISIAASRGLYPSHVTRVKGNPTVEAKRSLIAFSRLKGQCEIDTLIIEKQRGVYTENYIALTKDFYLKM